VDERPPAEGPGTCEATSSEQQQKKTDGAEQRDLPTSDGQGVMALGVASAVASDGTDASVGPVKRERDLFGSRQTGFGSVRYQA
jgi:hypothetical protein